MSDFDVAIGNLLADWEPRLGKPTCGPGCDRCCRRMTVIMTSAEGLELLAHPAAIARREAIQQRAASLPRNTAPTEALDALLDKGGCVFLDHHNCGVHAARPDGCRAAYVWHEPWFCGREEYDQCVPAELNALRVARVYERMLAELDAGRKPFWGFILPVAALLAEHGEAYRRGEDLASLCPAHWLQSELIEFPSRDRLLAERIEHERIFEEEPEPLGGKRAANAPTRSHLDAIPLY